MMKEGKEDLITICKFINNLEGTDRKDLILRRKGDAGYLRRQIIAKRNLSEQHRKVQVSSEKYRYLK